MEFGEGEELKVQYKWNVSLVKETIAFGGLHKGVGGEGARVLPSCFIICLYICLHCYAILSNCSIVGIQKCLVVLHSILHVPKASASPMTDIHQGQDTSLRQG